MLFQVVVLSLEYLVLLLKRVKSKRCILILLVMDQFHVSQFLVQLFLSPLIELTFGCQPLVLFKFLSWMLMEREIINLMMLIGKQLFVYCSPSICLFDASL